MQRIFSYVVALFMCLQSSAQIYNLIGTTGDEFSQSGAQLSNGDFVIFGHSNNSGQQNAWLSRFNSEGESIKAWKFGGTGSESGYGSVATFDGGFAVTGSTTSAGAGGKDIFVCKLSTDNNIVWQYTYGGTGDDESYEIIQTLDSGFMVVGYTRSFGNATYNGYVLKLSSAGAVQWTKVLYSNVTDLSYRCLQSDGYYYISSTINASSSFGLGDVHITKLDEKGNFVWNKAYGAAKNENSWKMIRTLDGKLAMVFASASYSGGTTKEMVFMKIDTAGNQIFATRLQNNGRATDGFDLVQLPDSSFQIVGHTLSSPPNGWQGILVNLKKDGTLNLVNPVASVLNTEGNFWQIKRTQKSGEFAIFGYGKNGATNYDFLFVKTDSTNNFSCLLLEKMAEASTSAVTVGEKVAKTAFLVGSGCTRGNLGWTLQTENTEVKELNYHFGYTTTMPNSLLRCDPDSVRLDAGLAQKYKWSNGAKTRVTWVKNFGTHTVKFWRNRCIGYDSIKILATTPENIAMTNDTCSSDPIKIGIGAKSGRVYQWQNGIKTSEFVADKSGKYILTMTDTSRKCVSIDSIQVHIPGIKTTIGIDSVNHCLTNNHLALSATTKLESLKDKITSIGWYQNTVLKDSAYKTILRHPDTGNFSAVFIVQTAFGCRDTSNYNYGVYANPTAKIYLQDTVTCYSKSEFEFINRSESNGPQFQHFWDMGSGSLTPDIDTMRQAFPGFGIYKVSLYCVNNKGCTHDTTIQLRLKAVPDASFISLKPDTQCVNGNSFSFQNTSSCDDTRRILSYRWNTGDNTPIKQSKDLTKQYADADSFTLSLQVITDEGCEDFATKTLHVLPIPVIKSLTTTPIVSCFNYNSIHFEILPKPLPGKKIWRIGDGSKFYDTSEIVHHYQDTGKYLVQFWVGNEQGCKDSIQSYVTILPSPNPIISINDAKQCPENNLFVFSPGTAQAGDTYEWQLSDGGVYNSDTAKHSFANTGIYDALLIGKNKYGCLDSATAQVEVLPKPSADFSADPVCLGFPSRLLNTSNVSGGFIAQQYWFYNNNKIGETPAVDYIFNQAGNHGISLSVVSSEGCKDSVFKPTEVLVYAPPVATFTWSLVSESMEEDLWMAQSSTAGAILHSWLTESGKTGYGSTFRYAVTDSHAMRTRYIAVDNNGCADTIWSSHIFPFNSNVFIPNAFTPNGDLNNQVFRPFIAKNLSNYSMWIFDRWGGLLFHTTDPKAGWDGIYKGEPLPDGVYVYKVQIGSKYDFGGTIHLMR